MTLLFGLGRSSMQFYLAPMQPGFLGKMIICSFSVPPDDLHVCLNRKINVLTRRGCNPTCNLSGNTIPSRVGVET